MRHASFHHRVRGSRVVARRWPSPVRRPFRRPSRRRRPASPPIVGAWLLTVDEFPEDPPQLVAFHADGTYHEADADGTTGIGSWEATGPTSFNLTFVEIFPTDDEGSVGMQTIRAAGEVSEDGQSFTAEFTVEFTGEGAPAGEYGPGHVTGTRINVEPMGTPVGSLDDLFGQFEEGTAPAGTAPAETTPAGTEPVGTEPAGTEPAGTEPAGTEPWGPRRPILRRQPTG